MKCNTNFQPWFNFQVTWEENNNDNCLTNNYWAKQTQDENNLTIGLYLKELLINYN